MTVLKRFCYLILLIIIIIPGMMFCLRNDTTVTVDFLFAETSIFSVGVWILLSFIVGCIFGLLMTLPSTIGLRLSGRNRQKKLDHQQNELLRLKGEPAEG